MLAKRLEHLNSTLDGVFEQLLGDLDSVHRVSAANYLHFEQNWYSTFYGKRTLSILAIAFGCEPELSKDIKNLILSEQPKSNIQDAVQDCVHRLYDLGALLNARCAGLLDVKTISGSQIYKSNPNPWFRKATHSEMSEERLGMWSLAQYCHDFQVRPFLLGIVYFLSQNRNSFMAKASRLLLRDFTDNSSSKQYYCTSAQHNFHT